MNLERAVGRIEGAIAANNKATDDKFTAILSELKAQKKTDEGLRKRLTVLEIDKRIVTRLAATIATLFSVITTALITLSIRLLT